VKSYPVELIGPDNQTVRIGVAEHEAVWDAARRAGLDLPSNCLQGWCLTCAGKVLEGDFDPSVASRYYPADRAAGFILLCTAKPLSPLRVRTNQKLAMQEHRLRYGLPTPRG
jgi:ferredoxin